MRQPSSRSRPQVGLGLLLAFVLLAGSAVAQQEAQPQRKAAQEEDPVEIVSDSLVVEQEKQLATFTGNVDAVQGEMRLRADKLLVYYQ
jgi:lipopolysaccharide export system protein LptA